MPAYKAPARLGRNQYWNHPL